MTELTDTVSPRQERTKAVVDQINKAFARHASARGLKYLSLHAALVGLVERGVLAPGVQLPSDEEIAHRLRLSVGTVQKAMYALREDGILERRQGAGTFVVDPSIDMHDVWHFCFLDDDGRSYLPLKARALKRGIQKKDGPWRLHVPGTQSFVAVTRIIDVNGEFNLLSDFYLDGDRFAELADEPIRQFDRVVLRNLLTERYGVRTKSARQLLRCEPLTARDCRILKLKRGSIGMILETFGTDQNDTPIYYQRVVIPQNDRKLDVNRKA